MKKVLSCILMAIVALSFAACGGKSSNSSKIVGKWQTEDERGPVFYTFNEDNTGTTEIIFDWNGQKEPYQLPFTYSFDNRSNNLKMKPDEKWGNEQWADEVLLNTEWIDNDHFYIIVTEGKTEEKEKGNPLSRVSESSCNSNSISNNSNSKYTSTKLVGTWGWEEPGCKEYLEFDSDNICTAWTIYNYNDEPSYYGGDTIPFKYNEETNIITLYMNIGGERCLDHVKLRWENNNCFYLIYHDYPSEQGPFIRQ